MQKGLALGSGFLCPQGGGGRDTVLGGLGLLDEERVWGPALLVWMEAGRSSGYVEGGRSGGLDPWAPREVGRGSPYQS